MNAPDVESLKMMAGVMIVTNLGTIGTIIWWSAKALWWVSKLDSRVSQNTKDINAAHKRVREVSQEN